MQSNTTKGFSMLIDYIALCGINQSVLVDYVKKLSPSELSEGVGKRGLRSRGLSPKIISIYPNESTDFPLPPNFLDVIYD